MAWRQAADAAGFPSRNFETGKAASRACADGGGHTYELGRAIDTRDQSRRGRVA
jgi:hypothetical protein